MTISVIKTAINMGPALKNTLNTDGSLSFTYPVVRQSKIMSAY